MTPPDRDRMRERLERINRQQLALNDNRDRGLWQDMSPVMDDLLDLLAPPDSFDPVENAKAALRYLQAKESGDRRP